MRPQTARPAPARNAVRTRARRRVRKMSRWNGSVRSWSTVINSIPINGSAATDVIDRAVSINSHVNFLGGIAINGIISVCLS